MSSAGLVHKYYGDDVMQRFMDHWSIKIDTDHERSDLMDQIYHDFFLEIDAIDNGTNQVGKGVPLLYEIKTSLSSRVSKLNPAWNAEDQDPCTQFL